MSRQSKMVVLAKYLITPFAHCKNKIVILAKYLVLQLHDYHSCASSKNLVLVKNFVGGK